MNMMKCMVCNDYKKAKNKENELRACLEAIKKIRISIAKTKGSFSNQDKRDIQLLNRNSCNIRFMCGKCIKFNDINMKNQYKELCEEIVQVKKALTENTELSNERTKRVKFELINITRGRFAFIANYIERNIKINK